MPEKLIHGFSPQGLASLYEAVRRQFVSPFGAVQFARSRTSKNVCKSATQSFIFCIGTSYNDQVLRLISIPFPPLDVFLSSMLLKLDKYLWCWYACPTMKSTDLIFNFLSRIHPISMEIRNRLSLKCVQRDIQTKQTVHFFFFYHPHRPVFGILTVNTSAPQNNGKRVCQVFLAESPPKLLSISIWEGYVYTPEI